MKLLSDGSRAVAGLLLGLMACGAEAAAGKPAAAPVTIRGSAIGTAESNTENGSTIVLRGSPPPAPPPAAGPACPPGYADVAGVGCVIPDYAAEQPDYGWEWATVDFGGRRRSFHPRRRGFVGVAHGFAPHARTGHQRVLIGTVSHAAAARSARRR